jgi:allophanate hydrolase subunit 2
MSKAFVQVLRAGTYTSIQDAGRQGYMHLGVPRSGYMDGYTASLANDLVGNGKNEACIEFFKTGLKLRFSAPTIIAIAAQGCRYSVDDEYFRGINTHQLEAGSIITVLEMHDSNWGYLAIAGGFQSEIVMASRSLMDNVTLHSHLPNGFVIPYRADFNTPIKTTIGLQIKPNIENYTMSKGPEFNQISKAIKTDFYSQSFKVASITRQAIRLSPRLEISTPLNGITSSFTPAGTIQVTPDGMIFILLRDGQTTGGYARFGFTCDEELNDLVQVEVGGEVMIGL